MRIQVVKVTQSTWMSQRSFINQKNPTHCSGNVVAVVVVVSLSLSLSLAHPPTLTVSSLSVSLALSLFLPPSLTPTPLSFFLSVYLRMVSASVMPQFIEGF